jgi:hypothetical protein
VAAERRVHVEIGRQRHGGECRDLTGEFQD